MNKSFLCSDRFLHENITNFTVEITQQCNFRCSYCCYSGEYSGMRKHTNRSMGQDTILDTIRFIKSHAHKKEMIVVSFFGGEALLQLNQIIYFIEELHAFFGDRILFDVSTNGLLLTSSTIDKLLQYNVGISVSLDGCKSVHDRNRRTKEGKRTFDHIVSNLLKFKESYPNEYRNRIRLLITVGSLEDIMIINDSFAQFKELLGEKPPFISHIYPNFKTGELYDNDIETEKMFLNEAIERKKKGIYDLYTIILDDLLKKSEKKFVCDDSCEKIHLRTCLDNMYSIFIDADGHLYPCEKFGTCHFIGDVNTGINKKQLHKWSSIYNFRRSVLCEKCQILEYCTRCLADLKMSFSEQKQMCNVYKKNIELAQMCNNKLNNNA